MTDHSLPEEAPGAAPESPAETLFQFSDLPDRYRAKVASLGWSQPMDVQARAIPLIRRGTDLIVQSRTGSGKTGAFLLPLLLDIDESRAECQALILVPTRELAIQVHAELERLTEGLTMRNALLYGGVGYGKQLRDLENKAQIVIGTPGRVLDHLDRGTFSAAAVRFLVLDEADEMLSMGFYPAMRKVRRWLPQQRQSLMFSATMPRAVLSLAKEFLHHPQFLTLSGDNVGVETLTHEYYAVEPMDKDRSLVRILEMENPANALIFCNRKSDVEYLFQFLQNAGYDVDRISGDLSQGAREKVMGLIRQHKVRFLIATDVAARGIDIQDLDIVFQYDVPQDLEIYVHRAGRTARAGKSGRCITLATYRDELPLREIQSKFRIPLQKKELPDLGQVSARVCERTTVLLEEQLRDAGSVMNERIDRFTPLAAELGQSDEGRRIIALLLDDYYHRSLHLPPRLPEEKIRFDEILDDPNRPPRRERERDRERDRDRDGRRERGPRRERRDEPVEPAAGEGEAVAVEAAPAEGPVEDGALAGGGRKRPRRRRRGKSAEGGPGGAGEAMTETGSATEDGAE
jgi:ATP-dependent RNA helicase DeaD